MQVEEAEKAFSVIERMDNQSKTRSMLAYRFRAHMMQCMGKHADAIETLSKALSPLNGRSMQEQRIECLYLRGEPSIPAIHHTTVQPTHIFLAAAAESFSFRSGTGLHVILVVVC